MLALPLGLIAFARSWWKAGAGALVGAFLIFPVGQCSGVQVQKDRVKAATLSAVVIDGKAKEVAAEQRGLDAATTAARSEGRLDAVKGLRDERPGAVRCEFNRRRLLDAGAKAVPACR